MGMAAVSMSVDYSPTSLLFVFLWCWWSRGTERQNRQTTGAPELPTYLLASALATTVIGATGNVPAAMTNSVHSYYYS
uniref:NADH dehydrogenase subunit 2 n=1 Tax=Ditylenchus dipsaci TaxID=166011 RepID=A0A915EEK3_9BILA